ncbi:hypothetical protein MAR_027749 [Mya arenaria]|uniref:Uncharacterized protein n=1 Tax=Mya arenaria TaxID=6604 RepID=A0ABY7EX72_MYAAR|nr:hypothetical protein MAR_027749 [Mya arenaria]
MCCLQGSAIIEGDAMNLFKTETAARRGIDCNVDTNDTRQIKLRSEKWFSARKEAKVTGSSIYRSIGESETIHGTWNTKQAKCNGYYCRKNSTIALS